MSPLTVAIFLSALSLPLHPQSSDEPCLTRAIGVSTWSIEDPHLESSRGPASHQKTSLRVLPLELAGPSSQACRALESESFFQLVLDVFAALPRLDDCPLSRVETRYLPQRQPAILPVHLGHKSGFLPQTVALVGDCPSHLWAR